MFHSFYLTLSTCGPSWITASSWQVGTSCFSLDVLYHSLLRIESHLEYQCGLRWQDTHPGLIHRWNVMSIVRDGHGGGWEVLSLPGNPSLSPACCKSNSPSELELFGDICVVLGGWNGHIHLDGEDEHWVFLDWINLACDSCIRGMKSSSVQSRARDSSGGSEGSGILVDIPTEGNTWLGSTVLILQRCTGLVVENGAE